MKLVDALNAKDHERVREIVKEDPSAADARLPDGMSALRFALYQRAPECVRALLDAGARVDVYDAATMGDTARVRALAKDASTVSADGALPLHLAAHFGHVDTVRALIDIGADPNALLARAFRNTPLHAACAAGQADCARALLEAGARPDIADGNGYLPLHVAAANGDVACVRALLAAGADPRAPMPDGKTARDVAVERKNAAAAALLGGMPA